MLGFPLPLWSRDALVSALALSLLHSLWQGALFGLLGAALHARLQRARPDIRYGAFSLLLLAVFVVWLGTFYGLYGTLSQGPARPVAFPAGLPPVITAENPATASAPALSPDPSFGTGIMLRLQPLFPVLVAVWALGVCLLSLRHLGGAWLLHRLCRSAAECPPEWTARAERLKARLGIRRPVLLRCSAGVDVPCAFGALRAWVLLPLGALTGLTPEQTEALIAHELAHLAQQDVLLHGVQVFLETVLFYHPAVRWLSRQVRIAREQRCDDLALQVIGDRLLYARALYSLEEARGPFPHLALGAKGDTSMTEPTNTDLLRRIRRILGLSHPERRDPWAKGALALGAAAVGLLALLPVHATPSALPIVAASANSSVSSSLPRIVRSEKVMNVVKLVFKFDGDKIELNTAHPTPDTFVRVNGQKTRFGSLSPARQQQVRQALQGLPPVEGTREGMGLPGTTRRIINKTKLVFLRDGKKIELNTTRLTPDTPVQVNGRAQRFGDLPAATQRHIRDQVGSLRSSLPPAALSHPSDLPPGMRRSAVPRAVAFAESPGAKRSGLVR